MFFDLNEGLAGFPKSADFCVVGSGPAGMTVAIELARNGRSVILLEGGELMRPPSRRSCIKVR